MKPIVTAPINLLQHTDDNEWQWIDRELLKNSKSATLKLWLEQTKWVNGTPCFVRTTRSQKIGDASEFTQAGVFAHSRDVVVSTSSFFHPFSSEILMFRESFPDTEVGLIVDNFQGVDFLTMGWKGIPQESLDRVMPEHLLISKEIESLYPGGRKQLLDDLYTKFLRIWNSWRNPIRIHLLGVWDGLEEVNELTKHFQIETLITRFPIRLGLKGRTLDEWRPQTKPLSKIYERDNCPEWTKKIVAEFREVVTSMPY